MKEIASFLPIFGIVFAVAILTVTEIFGLKLSKKVDSPKFVWFPISANILGLVIIITIVLIAIVLFAIGFIVAFGAGFNEGEKYFYLMILALILIPILIFAVRTVLFLLFKLGRLPIALVYSLVTTIINVAVVSISALVGLSIYENLFK